MQSPLEVRDELLLTDLGVSSLAGARPGTPGAVPVVALCRHKVDGEVVGTGQQYWLEAERAKSAAARDIVHLVDSRQLDWWHAKGRVLSAFNEPETRSHSYTPSSGSLHIAQGCGYDPGSAAYRFHSAVNQYTKHTSAFVRYGDTNPHSSTRQYDGVRDASVVREALLTADILHCHMNYMLSANATSNALPEGDPRSARPVQWRAGQWIVRHYHGSRFGGGTTMEHRVDERVRVRAMIDGGGLIRVGARLSLCAEPDASDLQWLPITIPVAQYRALVPCDLPPLSFRIAHSPTKRDYKGTSQFMAAVKRLQGKGLPIEPVLIEGLSHGDALRLKATCHLTFDSFWLGIQGSGLEAAAMGQPVIAGDSDVRELYRQHLGECPYVFANDEKALTEAIERLVTDPAYFAEAAARVYRYVVATHDYPVVARRYERILGEAMGRPDILTMETDGHRERVHVSQPDAGSATEIPSASGSGEGVCVGDSGPHAGVCGSDGSTSEGARGGDDGQRGNRAGRETVGRKSSRRGRAA